eukprot:COSAG02_NODE_44933_length_361_cov_1.568702_2_plen_41_part_01
MYFCDKGVVGRKAISASARTLSYERCSRCAGEVAGASLLIF